MPIANVSVQDRITATWANTVADAVNGVNDFTLITTGGSAEANWTLNSVVGYVSSKMLFLSRIELTRTTSALALPGTSEPIANDRLDLGTGNIFNLHVATLPSTMFGQLAYTQVLTSTFGGRVAAGYLAPLTGQVYLSALGGTSDVGVGEQISLGGVILLDT